MTPRQRTAVDILKIAAVIFGAGGLVAINQYQHAEYSSTTLKVNAIVEKVDALARVRCLDGTPRNITDLSGLKCEELLAHQVTK